ncbi:MAG: ribosome small subunit-dependent GTPase A [Paracoccaceae bacterium]
MISNLDLADLGWSAHFDRQLDGDVPARAARICDVHRDRLDALSCAGPLSLLMPDSAGDYAVGDWVVHDGTCVQRRLESRSLIARRAAGEVSRQQRIAANVDTLAIVTSCNADFNIARLERYLALAASAGCLPLIVLTKADSSAEADELRRRAERLSPLVSALSMDARQPDEAARLAPWCRDGQTLALVGSSGVGKTTLANALTGTAEATAPIRHDDAKGRHTTTARSLRRTVFGGWLVDTPGMRELRLTDAAEGIDAVFDDIASLAAGCRFSDCRHEAEPGCALRAAIDEGRLDPARLERWQKLKREDAYHSAGLAERRKSERAFGRMVSKAVRAKRDRYRD